MSDPVAAKRAARTAAKERRAGVPPDASARASARLTEVLKRFRWRPLAGYLPIHDEADPRAAMTADAGPVCVPVVEANGAPLLFRTWSPRTRLVAGSFGAMIPIAGDTLVPRILIVPLLAFDRRGMRLGYGGGYYDRTLAELRRAQPVRAIGFAFAAQEVPAVPSGQMDQPLDLIVTEDEVIEVQ